jgi:hypothetical protein
VTPFVGTWKNVTTTQSEVQAQITQISATIGDRGSRCHSGGAMSGPGGSAAATMSPFRGIHARRSVA